MSNTPPTLREPGPLPRRPFTTAVGGASNGGIRLRLNKTDWSNFNEGDDHSRAADTADTSRVAAHLGGELIRGTAP